jgi:GNAT superfamily N-acetyltransferase
MSVSLCVPRVTIVITKGCDVVGIRHIATLSADTNALAYVEGCFAFGCALDYFPEDRNDPTGSESCILAETEFGVPVGFVTFYKPEGDAHRGCLWVDLLWVEKTHRRMGVGTAMLERVVAMGQADPDIDRIEFGTGADNAAMQALGARCGILPRQVFCRRALISSQTRAPQGGAK